MKPPKCRVCHSEHWGTAHVFKSEPVLSELTSHIVATNSANKAVVHATNTEPPETAQERVGPVGAVDVPRTANRRARSDYNAYQREYMRKRRAKS